MINKSLSFSPANISHIFAITIFFIFGILWHATGYSLLAPATLAAALIIATVAIPKVATKNIVIVALTAIAFFSGNLRYAQQLHMQKHFFAQTNNKTFDIKATVQDIQKTEGKITPFCTTLYIKKIRESKHKISWKKLGKTIQIYTFKPLKLQVADKVKVKNITFKKPKNEEFAAYLIKKNIAATLFESNLSYKILYRPNYSLKRWLYQKKQNILNSLKRKMSRKLFTIFASLFLGNKTICKKDVDKVKTKFKAWGILHLLARSGLHLILFLLICEFILRCVPLYFFIKQIIMILLSILYLALSWPSISFIRAFSVLLFYKACPLLNTKPDLIHIVATVCFAMLLYNPIQLFFLDFQLSFLLTFTLAIFSKIQIKRKRKYKINNK